MRLVCVLASVPTGTNHALPTAASPRGEKRLPIQFFLLSAIVAGLNTVTLIVAGTKCEIDKIVKSDPAQRAIGVASSSSEEIRNTQARPRWVRPTRRWTIPAKILTLPERRPRKALISCHLPSSGRLHRSDRYAGLRKFTIEFSKRPMKWCLTFWNGLMKQCLRCPAEYEATVNYCAKDGRS